MSVGDKLFSIKTFVHTQEPIVLSVKFDPDEIASWKKLLTVQSIFGIKGLLMGRKVHVSVTWKIVYVHEGNV